MSCAGGSHDVTWGFNNDTVGSAKFYDQLSAQQVWKLPGGDHVFWVKTERCGEDAVKFRVGQ